MITVVIVLLFLLGILLIVKGGDFFVDAASWIAETLGIPKLVVGATIVSLATTLPEMMVSVMAAIEGKVDMAIGNAVGSVTSNVGLVMAIAIMFMPTVIKIRDYLLKFILMLGSAFILFAFSKDGEFDISASLVFLLIFVVAFGDNLRHALQNMKEKYSNDIKEEIEDKKIINRLKIKFGLRKEVTPENVVKYEYGINLLKFVLGAIGIVIGADLLTTNGSELARIIGISERVIGVTIIAIGTSLPELVTTITAIARKESSLSVGNIIGANIINLTLILPICALISGGNLPVSSQVATIDFPACLIVACLAIIPTLITKKFSRWQSVLLLGTYIGYMVITTTAVGITQYV